MSDTRANLLHPHTRRSTPGGRLIETAGYSRHSQCCRALTMAQLMAASEPPTRRAMFLQKSDPTWSVFLLATRLYPHSGTGFTNPLRGPDSTEKAGRIRALVWLSMLSPSQPGCAVKQDSRDDSGTIRSCLRNNSRQACHPVASQHHSAEGTALYCRRLG